MAGSVPEAAFPEDTPLMRQWREVKARHPDTLVFFRVGDFYELFREDAREGARLLGLTLTSRNNGAAAEVPMAGVPAKALDDYLGRLVRLGRRAAICDQVEDPATAQGIVRREVVETVTPGTVLHDDLLDAKRNNFLVVLAPAPDGRVGLAAADLSTGELTLESVRVDVLPAELGRLNPSELLLPRSARRMEALVASLPGGAATTFRDDWLFDAAAGREELARRYAVQSLEGLGFDRGEPELVSAAAALVEYVKEIHPRGAEQLQRPRIRRSGREMPLDEMTCRNLELVEPLRTGESGGTLLSVLDETSTAMGARLLRQWLLRPLVEPAEIWRRQEGVAELVERRSVRTALRGHLSGVRDVERLAGKVASARATPRDLLALGQSLHRLPELRAATGEARSRALTELALADDLLSDVAERILGTLADDPPHALQDGGVLRAGVSSELDELRALRDGARDFIASLQTRERERTGIGSLKIGFNRVFGYYLEITRSNLASVPADYIRKQTLANAERYFTPELKEWEEKVAGAEERIVELEGRLFQKLRASVAEETPRLQEAGRRLAELDVLATLAEVADRRRYVRPEVHTGFDLEIQGGRHPVVEAGMPSEAFIPNDLVLDDGARIVILTGPNMAGKSTVLRQVGLIQLMAQMGSFVPARAARLPVCDRIFTRVGASDNLARGQSTFMVEMNESAAILHGATRRSLVLLDEIGRGTSTYDGVSIAWAITEHLHEQIGAKTVFATHYHELTQLGDLLQGVKNMNVAVRETGDGIVFLRRLEDGGANRSYGIQVARLAGLPDTIIARATELLAELEGSHSRGGEGLGRHGSFRPSSQPAPQQLSLFSRDAEVAKRLDQIDPDSMTPLEALNFIHQLHLELRGRLSDPGREAGGEVGSEPA
jgi:DNA mismatch repair protein MutS